MAHRINNNFLSNISAYCHKHYSNLTNTQQANQRQIDLLRSKLTVLSNEIEESKKTLTESTALMRSMEGVLNGLSERRDYLCAEWEKTRHDTENSEQLLREHLQGLNASELEYKKQRELYRRLMGLEIVDNGDYVTLELHNVSKDDENATIGIICSKAVNTRNIIARELVDGCQLEHFEKLRGLVNAGDIDWVTFVYLCREIYRQTYG